MTRVVWSLNDCAGKIHLLGTKPTGDGLKQLGSSRWLTAERDAVTHLGPDLRTKREERLARVGGQECHGDRGREDELHDNEQPQHPEISDDFLSGRRRNLG